MSTRKIPVTYPGYIGMCKHQGRAGANDYEMLAGNRAARRKAARTRKRNKSESEREWQL